MFQISALYLLSPELSLALLALVVMLVDLFVKRRIVTAAVALIGLIIPIGFTISQAFLVNNLVANHTNRAFFGMFIVDPYAIYFDIVFLLIGVLMIPASYNYVRKYVKAEGEFYTLMLFALTGMMFLGSTTELISVYISLELATMPLYVMAGLLRTGERSAEAAVKYVLLGAMSSAIVLYGFALLYVLTGTTDLITISNSIRNGVQNGNVLILIASLLVLAGFGFKISAVPFHMWAPDIYEGSPTPSTAFFSVGSKAAGFAGLIRVFIYGGLGQVNLTSLVTILAIVAVLSMTLGNLVAAVQTNVKRLMAYSSIAQAGYILVGLIASVSGKNAAGIEAVLFYILVYVITNIGAFAGIIALANATGGERINDFRGLARRAPLLSAGTALCLLSLAGIPPLAGFVSKVVIFTAAWGEGFAWLVIIALLNTVISVVYYGRIVKVMYFDPPPKEDHLTIPIGLTSAIALTTAALIVITFASEVVLVLAGPAARSLLAFLPGR
ncbi:MAG TPA: NADH-quinone oxidoreductase subunit N [Ktedonobacteraceae bacterium]|nr:NADH-quinone oxidoreductase subunit N [Ktedonobacteraceae bacterium]